MEKIKSIVFHNRMKSLYWRTAMMALAFFLSGVSENIAMFELSQDTTVMAGLILGEISKQINTLVQNRA